MPSLRCPGDAVPLIGAALQLAGAALAAQAPHRSWAATRLRECLQALAGFCRASEALGAPATPAQSHKDALIGFLPRMPPPDTVRCTRQIGPILRKLK